MFRHRRGVGSGIGSTRRSCQGVPEISWRREASTCSRCVRYECAQQKYRQSEPDLQLARATSQYTYHSATWNKWIRVRLISWLHNVALKVMHVIVMLRNGRWKVSVLYMLLVKINYATSMIRMMIINNKIITHKNGQETRYSMSTLQWKCLTYLISKRLSGAQWVGA